MYIKKIHKRQNNNFIANLQTSHSKRQVENKLINGANELQLVVKYLKFVSPKKFIKLFRGLKLTVIFFIIEVVFGEVSLS